MNPKHQLPKVEACPPLVEGFGVGDPVGLVRQLGDAAVAEFLDGLAPRLAAVRRAEDGSGESLRAYLDRVVISANAVLQIGGLAVLSEPDKAGGEIAFEIAPGADVDSALAELM